jgi:hypothetical protein
MCSTETRDAFLPVPQDAFSAITAACKAVAFHKGNYAVYLGILPPGCRPDRANEIPQGIAFAGLLLSPTSPAFSQRVCLAFNRFQLESGYVDRRWAFVVKRSKARLLPHSVEDQAAAELLQVIKSAISSDRHEAAGGAR